MRKKCEHKYYIQNRDGFAECADCGLLATTIKAMAKKVADDAIQVLGMMAENPQVFFSPSDEIFNIWQEMRELKRLRDAGEMRMMKKERKRREELEEKFEDMEIKFGHNESLFKAIIFYLDEKYELEKLED